MEQIVKARIVLARGTPEEYSKKTILKNEIVLVDIIKNNQIIETKVKIGDGINTFDNLPYALGNVTYYNEEPVDKRIGDMWYDSTTETYMVYNGEHNITLSHVIKNIEDGLGDKSIQTTDDSTAGSMCFRFDSTKIHTQNEFYLSMTDEQKQKEFNVANKKFSMKLDNNFDYAGVAADLKDGVLTVQTLTATHNGAPAIPGTAGVGALTIDEDSFLFFPGYPELGTDILGEGAVALGINNKAQSNASFAEGKDTVSAGQYAHAEGRRTNAIGYAAHAEGIDTKAIGQRSHAEGDNAIAEGYGAHAQGQKTEAIGKQSHAEGVESIAEGDQSHAEGLNTYTQGQGAHSEGIRTAAIGPGAHAEGKAATEPLGTDGKLQNWNKNAGLSIAEGEASHIEGIHNHTGSNARAAHAEGELTEALGASAHAEGKETQAIGEASHTEGIGTIANGIGQHAQGKYNEIDENEDYAHIVGNGNNHYERSNIHTLDWDGNAWYAGDIKVKNIYGSSLSVKDDNNNNIAFIDNKGKGKFNSLVIKDGENEHPVLNLIGTGNTLPSTGKNGDIFKVPGAKLNTILKETKVPCKGKNSGFKVIKRNFVSYYSSDIQDDGKLAPEGKLIEDIKKMMGTNDLTYIYFCFPDKSYYAFGVSYDGEYYYQIDNYTQDFKNAYKKNGAKMVMYQELPVDWGFDVRSNYHTYTTEWTLLNDILNLITLTYPVTLQEIVDGNEIKTLNIPITFKCSWLDPNTNTSIKIDKIGVIEDSSLESPVGYWYLSLTNDSASLDGDFQEIFDQYAPNDPILYGLNRTYRTDTKYYIYNDDLDGDNWEELGGQLGNMTDEEKEQKLSLRTVGYEDFCTYQVTKDKDIITCLNEAIEAEKENSVVYIMSGIYTSESRWSVPLIDGLTFRGLGDGVIFNFEIFTASDIKEATTNVLTWNWENIIFEKEISISIFSLTNSGAILRSGKATNCIFNNKVNIQLNGENNLLPNFNNCVFNNNINVEYPYTHLTVEDILIYDNCTFNINKWDAPIEQFYCTEMKNCSMYIPSNYEGLTLGMSSNNFGTGRLQNNIYYLFGEKTYFKTPHYIANASIKNSSFPWNVVAKDGVEEGGLQTYTIEKSSCYINSKSKSTDIQYSTNDLEEGATLSSGTLYIVYEE